MRSEWRRFPLGDLVRFVSGSTPSKKQDSYWGGDIPWVSAKDMKSFLLFDSEDKITSLAKESGAKIVPAGTVLILTRGMTLLNDVPICLLNTESSFNQDVKAISTIDPKLSATYLPYALLGRKRELMSLVDLAGHGTGRLATDLLKSLEIDLPPLGEQKVISSLLGSIDNKIELNRKNNKILEGMAKALFKSWFVDFDPVRAKAKGRPTGLPDEIIELFPDSFEESELGEIPSGWTISSVKDQTSYLSRGISPKYCDDGEGVVVLNQKCIRGGAVDFSKSRRHDPTKKIIDGRQIFRYDCLINSTGVGTLGRVAIVPELSFGDVIVDSHVTVARGHDEQSTFYLTNSLLSRQSEIEALGEGSTGQTELSKGVLGEMKLVVPPERLLNAYYSSAVCLFEKSWSNERTSRTLASLRDVLLPRLVSGELRVPDAEKMLEEVGI